MAMVTLSVSFGVVSMDSEQCVVIITIVYAFICSAIYDVYCSSYLLALESSN
jgi:hypothetical protein